MTASSSLGQCGHDICGFHISLLAGIAASDLFFGFTFMSFPPCLGFLPEPREHAALR